MTPLTAFSAPSTEVPAARRAGLDKRNRFLRSMAEKVAAGDRVRERSRSRECVREREPTSSREVPAPPNPSPAAETEAESNRGSGGTTASAEKDASATPPRQREKALRKKAMEMASDSEEADGAGVPVDESALTDEDLLSDSEELDQILAAFGNDMTSFLKAPMLEVLRRTTKLTVPTKSFVVNSYYAANTQSNKLETKGYAELSPGTVDGKYKAAFKGLVKIGHRFADPARAALRMMKRVDIPPEKRMDAEMSRVRESKGADGSAYVELNNYCQRLQREKDEANGPAGAPADDDQDNNAEPHRRKNAQTLSTLIVWRLKAEFADGEFDLDATDPMVTVDAAFVEDLVKNPPKAPRKRKREVRGPRPAGRKAAAAAEESVNQSSADDDGEPPGRPSAKKARAAGPK